MTWLADLQIIQFNSKFPMKWIDLDDEHCPEHCEMIGPQNCLYIVYLHMAVLSDYIFLQLSTRIFQNIPGSHQKQNIVN